MAPWADVLYFADPRWLKWHQDKEEYTACTSTRVSIEGSDDWEALAGGDALTADDSGVFVLHNYGHEAGGVISDKPNGLATGQCSGYQAINFAYLAGCRRILLLGYDAKGERKKMHWFGDHPRPTDPGWLSVLPGLFAHLAKALRERGVEVINCSPDTAITCFKKGRIESLLFDPAAAALSA